MKKILYLQGHARYAREWGILGEIIQTLKENSENDVYYMDCNNTFNGFCWLTQNYHWGYCKKCQNGCHKILEHLNFSKKKILKSLISQDLARFKRHCSMKKMVIILHLVQ